VTLIDQVLTTLPEHRSPLPVLVGFVLLKINHVIFSNFPYLHVNY